MLGIRCCHGSVRGSVGRDASSVQSNLSVTGNPEFRNFPTTTILSRLNQRRKVIQSSSNIPRVDDATMFCLHSFMPLFLFQHSSKGRTPVPSPNIGPTKRSPPAAAMKPTPNTTGTSREFRLLAPPTNVDRPTDSSPGPGRCRRPRAAR